MLFIIIVLTIWVVYTFIVKKIQGNFFKSSNALLTLILISFIITLCLGINFAGANTLIDGSYSINNQIAYWVIGEDGWNYDVFRYYFNTALTVSIVFTLIYSTVKIFEK